MPETAEGNGTDLYRAYGPDGSLLYVGISISALARAAQHSKESQWFSSLNTLKVQKFRTREEAMEAERAAIISERPKFNIIYNKSRRCAALNRPRQKDKKKAAKRKPVEQSKISERERYKNAFKSLGLAEDAFTKSELAAILNKVTL
jgi:hypothetical protein